MSKPLRVLVVEDSEDDVLLTIHALKKGGYEPTYERVEDAEAMRKALETESWDVILCDYQMPKFSAPAAIALLKETDIDIPLMIVSGAIGEAMAVECMQAGARDYVMKGNLSRLPSAVERELEEAESRRQRKRAEELLRESEANYRQLFDNSPAGIYQIDFRTGKFIKANDVICKYLGCSPEEITLLSPYDVLTDDSKQLFSERLRKMGLGEKVTSDPEYEIVDKNGKHRWLQLNSKNIYDAQGLAVGADVVAHEITERKRIAEKNEALLIAVQREKLRLSSLLNSMTDEVWFADTQKSFTLANQSALKQFSIDPDLTVEVEKLAKSLVVLRPDGSIRPVDEAPPLRALLGEVVLNQEEIVKIPESGEFRYRQVSAAPVRDSVGNIVGSVSVVRDITEMKQAEKQLQDTLESLRKAVGTTIQVMVSAVETRDPYTSGHQVRSANLAHAIATEMGLPQDKIEGIRMAGSIHDIGKLSIPAEILSKPTKLSEIEFRLIMEHARQGFEMLKDVESPWPLAEIIYQHHERMDGSGYPRNLKGEEILIEARILSVADTVEAMASHRPYRPGLGIEAALNEIEKNSGIFYDTVVADAGLRLFREKGFNLEGN